MLDFWKDCSSTAEHRHAATMSVHESSLQAYARLSSTRTFNDCTSSGQDLLLIIDAFPLLVGSGMLWRANPHRQIGTPGLRACYTSQPHSESTVFRTVTARLVASCLRPPERSQKQGQTAEIRTPFRFCAQHSSSRRSMRAGPRHMQGAACMGWCEHR